LISILSGCSFERRHPPKRVLMKKLTFRERNGSLDLLEVRTVFSTMGAVAENPDKKKHGLWFRLFRALFVFLLLLLAAVYFVYILPFWGIPFNGSRHGQVPLTPPWALECWLWEDDVNTEAYVKELLEGYARHDFPVRTVLIDSPWSRRYNDFEVDEVRYPEPEKFFRGLQD